MHVLYIWMNSYYDGEVDQGVGPLPLAHYFLLGLIVDSLIELTYFLWRRRRRSGCCCNVSHFIIRPMIHMACQWLWLTDTRYCLLKLTKLRWCRCLYTSNLLVHQWEIMCCDGIPHTHSKIGNLQYGRKKRVQWLWATKYLNPRNISTVLLNLHVAFSSHTHTTTIDVWVKVSKIVDIIAYFYKRMYVCEHPILFC